MSLTHEQTVFIRQCMDCKRLCEPAWVIQTGFSALPGVPVTVSHGICDPCWAVRLLDGPDEDFLQPDPNLCVDCNRPAYQELDGSPLGEQRCWECSRREAREFGI